MNSNLIEEEERNIDLTEVNAKEKYFPISIIWSSIPMLTWFLPFVGHAAISDPSGWIYDFQYSYSIGKHRQRTCFGSIKKYIQLVLPVSKEEYIEAINYANEKYSQLRHNLIFQNCHDHVGEVLNRINYLGKNDWGTLSLIWLLIRKGKYVNTKAMILTYLPFSIILFLVVFVILMFVLL